MKPWCVTIQMKANELYFHAILFVFDIVIILNWISGSFQLKLQEQGMKMA